jgi:hypothetical protein
MPLGKSLAPEAPGRVAALPSRNSRVLAGLYWLSRIPVDGSYVSDILPGLLIVSIGLGGVFTGLTTAANAGVDEDKAGLAAGLLNTGQQLGAALGLAILSALATARTSSLLHGGHDTVARRRPTGSGRSRPSKARRSRWSEPRRVPRAPAEVRLHGAARRHPCVPLAAAPLGRAAGVLRLLDSRSYRDSTPFIARALFEPVVQRGFGARPLWPRQAQPHWASSPGLDTTAP